MADKIWIGKGVMPQFATEMPRQIIGIVGDIRGNGLDNDPPPTMYIPQAQVPDPINALNARLTPMKWIVRTRGNPLALSAAIQEQVRQVTGLPVTDVRTMDEVVSRSTSRQRFNMLLMTVFGSAALFLAAIGIYGLMAYSVQQRTQEIGIRLALGAATGSVRKMVVFQGMRLALAGVVVGIGAAFGLTRLIATFLFGVKDKDPAVFVAVAVLLAAGIVPGGLAAGAAGDPDRSGDRVAVRVTGGYAGYCPDSHKRPWWFSLLENGRLHTRAANGQRQERPRKLTIMTRTCTSTANSRF